MDTLEMMDVALDADTDGADGMGAIARARAPFARAVIEGEGVNSAIRGRASFFYTPLGVLARVFVSGLESGTYTLCVVGKGGSLPRRDALPPLYARRGYAWCSSLTARLSHDSVIGARLCLYAYDGEDEIEVASGELV